MNKIHSVHNIPFAAPPPHIFQVQPAKVQFYFQVQLARLLTKPLYALWPHKLHAIARQRDS